MAPKILLADDSMTAQNMGKRILAEGGYDVVTVSNGAAALKKIAEVRPELVILDVYMPGYSGLEVCERLRGALNTANLPVVLTVGKLEPFKPEEGSRVKADGLLVKPFEATDLLGAVKKLLDKAAAPAEPVHEDTIKMEPPVTAGLSDTSHEAWKTEALPDYEKTQKIEVPKEWAAVPAMSDVLEVPPQPPGAEPPMAPAADAAAFSVEPAPEFADESLPAFDLDLDLEEPAPPMPAQSEPQPSAPASADSILDALMPELEQNAPAPTAAPAAIAPMPEIEFTAAPQAQDVVTETLPELEPTVLQDSIPVEVASDAALVTSPEELAQFTTKFGVDNPEQTPVGIVADLPAEQAAALTEPQPELVVQAPAEESAAPLLEELLETELAAAPVANVEEVAAARSEALPAAAAPEPDAAATAVPEPEEVPMGGIEAAPVVESAPAVEEVPIPEPETLPEMAVVGPEPVEPVTSEPPMNEVAPVMLEQSPAEPSIAEQTFSLEQELQRAFADVPSPASEDESGGEVVPIAHAEEGVPAVEDAAIDQLVERLMERLKPEVVAAIIKELKG